MYDDKFSLSSIPSLLKSINGDIILSKNDDKNSVKNVDNNVKTILAIKLLFLKKLEILSIIFYLEKNLFYINMNINLDEIIKNSFQSYDTMLKKYKKYIDTQDIKTNRDTQKIIFNNEDEFNYELAGMFDSDTQIWMWAWMIPEFLYKETILVRKLLNYGLKIEPMKDMMLTGNNKRGNTDQMLYLKTQLVNSRFLLDNKFQLDLHLSIATYLVKENIKFIYPREKIIDEKSKKSITVYYFIY